MVEEILSEHPNDWGYFGVYDGKHIFGYPSCEYRKGIMLSNLPEEIMNRQIEYVAADGGWSRMDYTFKLKEKK